MGWLPFISSAPPPPSPTQQSQHSTVKPRFLLLALLLLFSLLLLLFLLIFHLSKADTRAASAALANKKPTRAISRVCSSARFPSLCITSLLHFPHSESASESTLPSLYINLTLHHFGRTLFLASDYSGGALSIHPPPVMSALSDCLELLEDAVHLLSDSLTGGTSPDDTTTWLSAALTNQDTCMEGLQRVGGPVIREIGRRVGELSRIARNCLSIHVSYANMDGGEASGRALMEGGDGMPHWLKREDRRLLETPAMGMQADIVVSWRGENGTVKTIKEGIRMAPEYSQRRIVIYVKAGRYEEKDLKVGRKKTNVMLIGDGKGVTVISGGKNVLQNITTFHTASFAATGGGFMARDMTFENWAGPTKHQAVALRVGADHAVIYRCNIIGYQDSLYAHSQRQFFRECDIYGTVDFIFGNAAAVFQNCSIYARPPLPSQKNTVVAQGRKDPSQNTGFSIQASRLLPTADNNQNTTNTTNTTATTTYLGRPWKQYSRVVYMQSYMGPHLHPRGWLEWNTSAFALDTLYFGEYMNYGPGSITDRRVNWTGYRIIDSAVEAGRFTVASFISGQSWLPSTGVAYQGGLTL